MEESLEQLAANVRRHRARASLTQEELGSRSGVHPTAICKVEQGAREPRLSMIVRLARGLDTTPAQLLRGVK